MSRCFLNKFVELPTWWVQRWSERSELDRSWTDHAEFETRLMCQTCLLNPPTSPAEKTTCPWKPEYTKLAQTLNEQCHYLTLGERGSGGRAKSSSSASCTPAGTVSEGRVPLYMWNLQWGLVAMAKSSRRGNQSWESLVTHNSIRRWVLLIMHLCRDKENIY